jgi:hypothetical protein
MCLHQNRGGFDNEETMGKFSRQMTEDICKVKWVPMMFRFSQYNLLRPFNHSLYNDLGHTYCVPGSLQGTQYLGFPEL